MEFLRRRLFREKPTKAQEERLIQIKATCVRLSEGKARQLSLESFTQEAQRIAQACGMFKQGRAGYGNRGLFQAVGLEILQYPPELGYVVLSQMSLFQDELGYNPIGRTIVTLGKINSEWQPVITRASYMDQRPEVARLIEDSKYRAEKAGQFIAVAILQAAKNVSDVPVIYNNNTFDPDVDQNLIYQVGLRSLDIARIMTARKR